MKLEHNEDALVAILTVFFVGNIDLAHLDAWLANTHERHEDGLDRFPRDHTVDEPFASYNSIRLREAILSKYTTALVRLKGLATPKPKPTCPADIHREIMGKHFGNEGLELDYKYVSWLFTSDDWIESTTGLWLLDNESGYREHKKAYYTAKRDLMRAEFTVLAFEYANQI